jgi:hypothetical protein
MAFEENGSRIDDLKLILQRVSYAATLFDDDGISVRFMNNAPGVNPRLDPSWLDNIRSEQDVDRLMQVIQFKGLTPMGTELKNKVVEPLIVQKAKYNQLQKPVLVIAITDGQPAGEAQNAVVETIKYATSELGRTRYGPGAVAFQFAQVGNDEKAREFLDKLDNDPVVGGLVDCTSSMSPRHFFHLIISSCANSSFKTTRMNLLRWPAPSHRST